MSPTIGRSFGAVLRSYRTNAGLTQEELAERAGLSRRGIADLERGARLAPHAHTVEQLAAALGLPDVERGALMAASRHPARTRMRTEHSAAPALSGPDRTEFVGRSAELERLRAACDRALGGQSICVLIDGELGIGKTALCERLAVYARHRGMRTLIGRCYEDPGVWPAYAAFAEALRGYSDAFRTEEEHWHLLRGLIQFFKDATAVQPLVLILEDLQWADRGSLDLFRYLARDLDGTQLLLVGTYRDAEVSRDHPLSGVVAELRRRPDLVRIALRGLSHEEVRCLACKYAARNVSEVAGRALYDQTEGNPLFLQEIVRFLIDRDLGFKLDIPTAHELIADALPESLRDVIRGRLAKLSDDCNQVLSIASVIGREFELELVTAVADKEQVLIALEEARRARVIADVSQPRGVRFRFVHVLFSKTLYDELSAPRRVLIHQRMNQTLERRDVKARAERAAGLTDHFVNSSNRAHFEPALHYVDLAESSTIRASSANSLITYVGRSDSVRGCSRCAWHC